MKLNCDTIYNSVWIKKFVSSLGGSSKLFTNLVKFIKIKHRYETLFLFFEILEKIKPTVFTFNKKRGKTLLKVPLLINNVVQYKKAIHWLLLTIKSRKENLFLTKIYLEFLGILKNHSTVYNFRKVINKNSILNRTLVRHKKRS